MKKLLPILLIFTGCAMRAQQSFPGVNITPNGGAAGKINFRSSANVNKMFIQESTIDSTQPISFLAPSGSGTNTAFDFVTPGFYLTRMYNTGIGGWFFTGATFSSNTGATWPGTSHFIVTNSTGNIGTSGATVYFENGGLSGDSIALKAPSGAVTSSYTFTLPTGPGTSGYFLSTDGSANTSWVAGMSNPMTTNGDMIYQNSGVPARLAIGAANTCLYSTGGAPIWSTPCGSDPAWTSYTPTVTSTSGSVTTSSVAAAYIQTGKTVKVRILWTGSTSTTTTGIQFTLPVTVNSVTYQTLATAYFVGADFIGASSLVVTSLNIVGVGPTGVGATFPASTSETIVLEGIYESN